MQSFFGVNKLHTCNIWLPEELLQIIVTYLYLKDYLNFLQINKYCYSFLQTQKILYENRLMDYKDVKAIVEVLVDNRLYLKKKNNFPNYFSKNADKYPSAIITVTFTGDLACGLLADYCGRMVYYLSSLEPLNCFFKARYVYPHRDLAKSILNKYDPSRLISVGARNPTMRHEREEAIAILTDLQTALLEKGKPLKINSQFAALIHFLQERTELTVINLPKLVYELEHRKKHKEEFFVEYKKIGIRKR